MTHTEPKTTNTEIDDTEGNMPPVKFRGPSEVKDVTTDDTEGSAYRRGVSPEGETDDTEGNRFRGI